MADYLTIVETFHYKSQPPDEVGVSISGRVHQLVITILNFLVIKNSM